MREIMASSGRENIEKALDLLKTGLLPFFERKMRAAYGENW
jgi:hypothetical protein